MRDFESDRSKDLVDIRASLAMGSFNDFDLIKATAEGVASIFIVNNVYEAIEQKSGCEYE